MMREGIEFLKEAWTGEPFEFNGRTAQVLPRPAQQPRPKVILGGAQGVTATLWSLPTTAAYRRFAASDGGDDPTDPMADVILAVDRAHETAEAGCAVNRWQRQQMRRWRDGDITASPLYWAALVTFTVDGAR